MNDLERTSADECHQGGRLRMPRSRGAASGLLLILLGLWGAAVPFVGPSFDFSYSLGQEWSAGRGWLQVLPGAVAAIGGLLLLVSRNRATAMLGGWLAVLAGAWFVVGRAFAGPLNLGDVGTPVATTETKRVWLELTQFYGLGALIVFLGALALGRLSIRSARDVEHGHRPIATAGRTDVASDVPTDTTGPLTREPSERPASGWRARFGGHRKHRTTAV